MQNTMTTPMLIVTIIGAVFYSILYTFYSKEDEARNLIQATKGIYYFIVAGIMFYQYAIKDNSDIQFFLLTMNLSVACMEGGCALFGAIKHLIEKVKSDEE